MAQAIPASSPSDSHDWSVELDSIPDTIRAVAAQHPDRVAYLDHDRSMTYAEVDRASNRIAHALLGLGATDAPLVIVAPLGIDAALVILGGLKAGQLVVPVDPRWPPERWGEVTRRTGGRLAVPDEETRGLLGPELVADALTFADLEGEGEGEGDEDPRLTIESGAPAFVFFTSGSTGAPKGTLVSHEMAVRALDIFDVTPDMRISLLAPLGFITGAIGAIGILLTGGSGAFLDLSSGDLAGLVEWIDEQQITVMALTVTVIGLISRMAIDEGRTLDSVQHVGFGGEAGSAEDFELARRAFPNANLRHAFGLTETGPVAGYEVGTAPEPEGDAIPVGHPFPWFEVTIVDDDGSPVAPGEPGEIWVRGRNVALEYWDEPVLTAERFVDHGDGSRTVRTGDRGRFRDDGMLVHLGRLDRRVKVAGQFVDLTAVEHELESLDAVQDAVVSAVPTPDRGYRVIAHIVVASGAKVTVGHLRRELSSRLAPYMIPRAFFRIYAVPMTVNGKIDRVLLRDLAIGALPLESEFVPPRDDREREIAALFAEVLGVVAVGIHDDFFELGGDSLSVVDLLAGISERFGLQLTSNELLLDATVEGVAGLLAQDRPGAKGTLFALTQRAGRPVFMVPCAGGTPVQFRGLARRLVDRPVHAFAYRGMEGRAVPDWSVARIARRNLAAMRAARPAGPYAIGGFSFGGGVAIEMARMLQATDAELEVLVLLEPALVGDMPARLTNARGYVARVGDRAVSSTPGRDLHARVAQASALAREVAAYASRQAYLASAGIVPRRGQDQYEVFFQFHERLGRAYRAEPFRGPTIVFGSREYLDGNRAMLDHVLPGEPGGHRRDVEIAGGHLDLIREPNVAEVARLLEDFFATNAATQGSGVTR